MKKLRKKIYGCAPAHTVYLGPGRKEFHPKKPRPGIEHYIFDAGRESVKQVANPEGIDQGVIGNFMAARFNHLHRLSVSIFLCVGISALVLAGLHARDDAAHRC